MKRTTIVSFIGALLTLVFIIGYITFHSNEYNNNKIENTGFLSAKDSIELPKVKHIDIDYIATEEQNSQYLISYIEVVPSANRSKLHAPAQLLEKVKTEVHGDTLRLSLDLRNEEFWSKQWKPVHDCQEAIPLLSLSLDHNVVSVSANDKDLGNRINYLFKGLNLPHFNIRIDKGEILVAECIIGHLKLSYAHSLSLNKIKAEVLTLMDLPDESGHNNISLEKMEVDTLDLKVQNYMNLNREKGIKHYRWEALQEDAAVSVNLCKGQALEEVQSDK